MLNYETLLSSYDDKLTLMQWLKKVEEALKDASATSFDVIKTGDATLKFAITFEDGTSLVSGEIVLQQGESVASGEIRNGHLYLTLTNGQELDCGLLFNGEIPSMQVRALEVTGGLIVGDDANATIGGDLVVHGLTEVQNLLAYGHVETETLTAAGDKITAEKPIIEVMNGYTFIYPDNEGIGTANILFATIAKNGNKLTLSVFAELTRTNTPSSFDFMSFGVFSLPSNIMNRLVPYSFDNRNILAFSRVALFGDDFFETPVELNTFLIKYTNTIVCSMYDVKANMQLNKKYIARYEITLLLSDNLAA